MHIKTKGSILSVVLSVLISASVVTGMVFAATTIGTNIDTAGNLTVTGTTTLTGAFTANGNVTLGDAVADVVVVGGAVAGVNPLTFAGGPATGNIIFGMPDPGADITVTFPNLAGTVALSTNNLGVFAATTSLQLASVISDETGSGALVFATSPTLTTPIIGTGGTPLAGHRSATATVVSASIPGASCGNYGTITVTGAAVGNTVTATPSPIAGGIETVNLMWEAFVSAANTVTIRACNPTAAAIDTADTQTWRATVWQY